MSHNWLDHITGGGGSDPKESVPWKTSSAPKNRRCQVIGVKGVRTFLTRNLRRSEKKRPPKIRDGQQFFKSRTASENAPLCSGAVGVTCSLAGLAGLARAVGRRVLAGRFDRGLLGRGSRTT